MPDGPLTDPGVRYYRTGLLRTARIRTSRKITRRDPGNGYTHLIQQSLEPGPSVTTALTAPIEPLEQDALAPVKELSHAGGIANNPVI